MPPGGDPESRPYFFLSYAHTPRRVTSAQDPHKWVGKLCDDLFDVILDRTDAQPEEAGFMDRQMREGIDWTVDLSRALATCRVFVPLYSPRYFGSPDCGREWFAFSRRIRMHEAKYMRPAQAIVPGLWAPVALDAVPPVVQKVNFDPQVLGNHYAEDGLAGIIKLPRYRSSYKYVVNELAKKIIQTAQETPVEPVSLSEFTALECAFGTGQSPLEVYILVAARSAAHLPVNRNSSFYGASGRDWNPYYPDCGLSLAEHAANVVSSMGHQPVILVFDEEMASGVAALPDAPGLFLVDPWWLQSEHGSEQLSRFDEIAPPGLRAVIPWSDRDDQLNGNGRKLKAELAESLSQMFSRTRLECQPAIAGISSIAAFDDILPSVISSAGRSYLNNVSPVSPNDQGGSRPKLGGPGFDITGGPG